MTIEDRALLNAALRTDFGLFLKRGFMTLNPGRTFLPNWHLLAIAHQLERIRRGEINRLIINLPPRSLKSLMVTVAFPAFVLGHEPNKRIFTISYGDDLANKHSSDFRSIVESDWYGSIFPKMRIARSLEDQVITSARGSRKSTTVMGALTGLGGDLFILDDPQKAVDALSESRRNSLNNWFSNTLVSRLDNKQTGAIIVVMQRVHMNDLCGFLTEASDDWTVLSLPAIAEVEERIPIGDDEVYQRLVDEVLHPAHESRETLEKLRRTLGSDIFAAQYQQAPVPLGGGMIKRIWLRYYETHELPERTYRVKVIQSWDTAAKDGAQNDWSVCTTWLVVDGIYYLLDVTRVRCEYPRLRDAAIALAQRFKPTSVLIEDACTGSALASDLRPHLRSPVKLVPVDRDKKGRLYVQQAKFEAGCVLFPKGAAFLAELEAELLTFPQSRHDDQVDSISQALNYDLYDYTTAMMAAMSD
jgi:predicted phage terminase large subunit-like protein